ncbi:MAG: YciI family protein [Actinomycetota bacterium]
MPKYLLSLHNVEGEAPRSDEEMQRSWKEIQALNDELHLAGAWVFGGALHEPDTATFVRMSGGEVLTTDGPFVEAREHLGGFYVIEADDLRRRPPLGVEDHRRRRKAPRGPSVPGRRGLTAISGAISRRM